MQWRRAGVLSETRIESRSSARQRMGPAQKERREGEEVRVFAMLWRWRGAVVVEFTRELGSFVACR